jgi:diguanylate cyclase (GGDEF)-like protein/PAS domain S-box-containing protein
MRIALGPVARISLGLVSLVTFLILTLDLIFSLLPDQTEVARQIRKKSSEALAIQLTALVQTESYDVLRKTLHAVMSRDDQVISLGVRRADGELVAETSNHRRLWVAPTNNKSTLTHVVVPVSSGKQIWGQIEVAYQPTGPKELSGWLKYPSVALTLTLMTVGFLVFYLYLRRILQRLDPNAAIPDRVRTAFDALSEGVLVIDDRARMLLANSAFRALHPQAERDLTGKPISELGFLIAAVGEQEDQHPWRRAMKQKETISGETLKLAREDGPELKVTLNCSPVTDDGGKVRGCLITFDDLSMVEHMNQLLLDTVAQLEVAKKQIETQNQELRTLADHDLLTGALTRRAFLEQAQQHFLKTVSVRGEVCCVMADIDYFKSINDRYGHLVGDQVISQVARIIRSTLHAGDLLCRYGGEEFCILLTDVNAQQAVEFSGNLRKLVEANCGQAVIPGENVHITVSLGVAALEFGGATLAELIKQADQALYLAKGAGRNRVARYDDMTSTQIARRFAA